MDNEDHAATIATSIDLLTKALERQSDLIAAALLLASSGEALQQVISDVNQIRNTFTATRR